MVKRLAASRRRHLHIRGTGSYLPERRLDNRQLAEVLGVTEDWILRRTGIRQRCVADPEQATSDLAVEAAREAVGSAGISTAEIDLIIVATSTPDTLIPSTASRVQHRLGIESVAFDLGAACSGFIYGLATAGGYLKSGLATTVLLIAAETRTRFTNYSDRNTAVLYGDGAGAVVLSLSNGHDKGLSQLVIGADGRSNDTIAIPAGGSRLPASHDTVEKNLHSIRIEGQSVITAAVRCLTKLISDSLGKAGLTSDDLTLIIPHQMNLRIIEIVAKQTRIPMQKFFTNINECGNTSAASIPIALDTALRQGRIHSGDVVLLVTFGAGYTWGSALIRW